MDNVDEISEDEDDYTTRKEAQESYVALWGE
jgi:hypothetical protein